MESFENGDNDILKSVKPYQGNLKLKEITQNLFHDESAVF